jgi:hypothetical protein
MTTFQNTLWGYALTYPEHWIHQSVQDADAFAPAEDLNAGQLSVRGEWNWERQLIEPLWNRHIGMLAGMLGANRLALPPGNLGCRGA